MKKQQGFTLLELVIVIVIISILAAITSYVISQGFLSFINGTYLTDSDWQARLAMERFQRDLRSVRSSIDFIAATTTGVSFVNFAGNTVTYFISGNNLMWQLNANTPYILANGVKTATFTYYDRNGAATAVLPNIRFVTLNLNVVQNNTNYTVTTSAYTRNSF